MLVSALKSGGIGFIIKKLSDLFKTSKNNTLNKAYKVLNEVSDVLENGDISPQEQAELNRHLEEMTALDYDYQQSVINDVNRTIQQEVASQDPFVRRMRPTFGYIMAITWFCQMIAVAYIIFFDPENAPAILSSLAALSPIWGVGLSVLGIYVYKRSEDKKIFTESTRHSS